MAELVYVFYRRNKLKKLACKWFGPYRRLNIQRMRSTLVPKVNGLQGIKLKVGPTNSQVASPLIEEQDPKPSETSDVTDTVSSVSKHEMILEGDNIADQPPRYNRRYNLRPSPDIRQPFGDYYVHCYDVVKSIYFC